LESFSSPHDPSAPGIENAITIWKFGEGKTGVPGEKPLGARKRINDKLNPHLTQSPGFESGPH